MNDFVIETNDLTKYYGEQVCVAQLCLHVPKGKIYALLGRNGAGKTTTMKMLLNLVKPTSGFIKIFNDIHLEDISGWFNANIINTMAIISIVKPIILDILFFM